MKLPSLVILVLALFAVSESKKKDVCEECIEPYTLAWYPVVEPLRKHSYAKLERVLQVFVQIAAGPKYYVVFQSLKNKICIGTYVLQGDDATDFVIRCLKLDDPSLN